MYPSWTDPQLLYTEMMHPARANSQLIVQRWGSFFNCTEMGLICLAKKSFDGLCSRLQNLLNCLWKVVSENNAAKKDDIVGLSFSAIQIVNTMFCSMTQNQKEQSRAAVLRLLAQVISQMPPLFSPDQMNEVRAMIPSNDSYALPLSSKERDSKVEKQTHENVNLNNTDALAENANKDSSFVKECVLYVIAIDSSE